MTEQTKRQRLVEAMWSDATSEFARELRREAESHSRSLYEALRTTGPITTAGRYWKPHMPLFRDMTVEISRQGSPVSVDGLMFWGETDEGGSNAVEEIATLIPSLLGLTNRRLVTLLEGSLRIEPKGAGNATDAIGVARSDLRVIGPLDVLVGGNNLDAVNAEDLVPLLRGGRVLPAPLPDDQMLLVPLLPGPAWLRTVTPPSLSWDLHGDGVRFTVYEQFVWSWPTVRGRACQVTLT